MATSRVIAALFQLQVLDLDLDRLKAEKQALSTSLQGSVTLRKLRIEYDTAQQQLQAGLQSQKEAEWTLEELNQRLAAQEKRLYDGTISNGKELQTLQQEVQRIRGQQNRQEERVLEVIDSNDALVEAVRRCENALKKAEEAWKEEQLVLQERQDQLEQRSQEMQQKRAVITAGLDESLVQRYDLMRKSKQGRAVSKVEQSSCQWCRVILTPSEMQRVRTSSEIQTCLNCGRILYYER
ncbi:MAG TPA: C4-type zinc ribbon domain-containing protein [Dictyobacter sp.]|jgi:predicted  nucleic acid-binding Zn-ribbon protein|nr:C4-type zinc ribbon domain-containing protein [Dictyobacter sp.]